jgi:NmrA-like family
VARSLAKNKTFHVRGITRNAESEKARELSKVGVEIVQADGWNKEQMTKAFKGSWGVFVNTNTEDPVSVTLTSMIAPISGSTRGRRISGGSKRVRIEDIHFTSHKVHGCLWFLITALITATRAACYGPEIARALLNTPTIHFTQTPAPGEHSLGPDQTTLASATHLADVFSVLQSAWRPDRN